MATQNGRCRPIDAGVMVADEAPDHVSDSLDLYFGQFLRPTTDAACVCGAPFDVGYDPEGHRCCFCGSPIWHDHQPKDRDGDVIVEVSTPLNLALEA